MRSLADSRIIESEADGSDFGSKFLNLRKLNNLTRGNIAEKTGRIPEFIKDVEENKTTPPVGFLIQLSEVFDVDPGTFLNDDEEFIYVLEGRLELTLDNKKHQLILGESIKFNSNIPHKLKSLGDVKTKCLVTLYTP